MAVKETHELMVLRQFAGQAMAGMLANPTFNPKAQVDYDRLVKLSWSFANDMKNYYLDVAS